MIIFLLVILLIAAFLYGFYSRIKNWLLRHLPANQPDAAKRQANKTVVVCAGDSITHGIVSVNYVDMLEQKLPAGQFQFFNAGINSDLSYTLLRRLDAIIVVQPDVITILIGTNDINAALIPQALKRYQETNRVQPDDEPSFATYQANYRAIVQRLKTETSARIALLSLPPMSEDLANEVNQRADQYSQFVKELAQTENLTYLPVRETMTDWIQEHPKPIRYPYSKQYSLMTAAVLKNTVLGHSWDRISTDVGQDLTFDHLHLNTRGATMIAALIESFILKSTIRNP